MSNTAATEIEREAELDAAGAAIDEVMAWPENRPLLHPLVCAPLEQPQRKVLCARQDQIDITLDDEGNAEITQSRWPDGDASIFIARDNVQTFLDALCDALGVQTFGGSR